MLQVLISAVSCLSVPKPFVLDIHRPEIVSLTNIPLKNALINQFFVAAVELGNGQKFQLAIDTGSSDTWFRGPNCKSQDSSCDGRKADLGDKDLKELKRSFVKPYGSGRVSGYIYNATVSLGQGIKGRFPIGISSAQTGFTDGVEDGLMGFGWNGKSTMSAQLGGLVNANFFDSLGFKGQDQVFGIYLSNAENGNDGELSLGGVNTARYTGPVTYLPLTSEFSTWQFSVVGMTFKVGDAVGNAAGSRKIGFADTGATLMILDPQPAEQINKAIGAKAYNSTERVFPIDCKLKKTGPDVIFNLGGAQFAISSFVYVFEYVDGTCYSGFTQGADRAGAIVFGDTFLRQYYSVYDKFNKRIGFAKAVHPK